MIVGDNSFKIEYEVENIDVNIEKFNNKWYKLWRYILLIIAGNE